MIKDISSAARVLLILFVGFLLIVFSFSIHFDWPNTLSNFDRFLYLNRFFVEFLILCGVLVLLTMLGRIGRALGLVVLLLCLVIYFSQAQSFATIGQYLPPVALENASHVDFLNLDNIIFSALIWTFFSFFILKKVKENFVKVSWMINLTLLSTLLLTAVLIKNDHHWLNDNTLKARVEFYNSGAIGIEQKGPLSAFIETFREYLDYSKRQSAVSDKVAELSKSTISFIVENFDYFGKQEPDYPLVRITYFEKPNFLTSSVRDVGSYPKERKNIIVFFAEGFSARLMQPYSDKFDQLTPNINEFSKSAIRVDNYYNHTFATYRGLGGQLCSIFPVGKLYEKTDYYCLGHALQDYGYRTRFMISQSLDRTDLGRVLRKAGIQEVDGRRNIAKLISYNDAGVRTVTDRTLFEGLIARLKLEEKKADSNSPFMLGLYNFETHTGVTLFDKISPYKGSQLHPSQPNNLLDTFYNFDQLFGEFWDYFRNSSLYENTIVVLTTDHATFPSKDYVELVKEDSSFQRIFIDQIPLLIYHPDAKKELVIDAQLASSLDFAPSMLNLLNVPKTQAPFLGQSIFTKRKKMPFASLAGGVKELYFKNSDNGQWMPIPEENAEKMNREYIQQLKRKEFINYSKSLERSNQLWKK